MQEAKGVPPESIAQYSELSVKLLYLGTYGIPTTIGKYHLQLNPVTAVLRSPFIKSLYERDLARPPQTLNLGVEIKHLPDFTTLWNYLNGATDILELKDHVVSIPRVVEMMTYIKYFKINSEQVSDLVFEHLVELCKNPEHMKDLREYSEII